MDRGRAQRRAAARRDAADAFKAVRPARPSAPPPTSAEPPAARPAKPSTPPLAPIERRLKRELARGRAAIDAALDLHRLTQPKRIRLCAASSAIRRRAARGWSSS